MLVLPEMQETRVEAVVVAAAAAAAGYRGNRVYPGVMVLLVFGRESPLLSMGVAAVVVLQTREMSEIPVREQRQAVILDPPVAQETPVTRGLLHLQ
jgi:hypothetical protein